MVTSCELAIRFTISIVSLHAEQPALNTSTLFFVAIIPPKNSMIGTDGSIGHIYAFDRTTGAVRWKYRVDQRGVASDVLRLASNAYAVTLGDELLCLDLATGKAKWTFHSGFSSQNFHWTSTPSLTAERIYFAGLDG